MYALDLHRVSILGALGCRHSQDRRSGEGCDPMGGQEQPGERMGWWGWEDGFSMWFCKYSKWGSQYIQYKPSLYPLYGGFHK